MLVTAEPWKEIEVREVHIMKAFGGTGRHECHTSAFMRAHSACRQGVGIAVI